MKYFKDLIIENITGACPQLSGILSAGSFENPKNPEFGDIALPCFKFSGLLKKPPVAIAEDFSKLFAGISAIEGTVNINGYLNFRLNRKLYADLFLEEFSGSSAFDELGKTGIGKTVVIDYSHPNVAKNMGIHNLRSTVIGRAVYNIHEFLGYKTVGVNHLGDWGTQFGKLMWALEEWSSFEELEEKGILFLNDIYVRFHTEAESRPELDDFARVWFKRLEDGDERAVKWWKLFIKVSMEAYGRIYKRLNVSFDHVTGESFYIPFLESTVKELEAKGLTEISEGALVVKFDEADNMPPCLIKKSDGATLYATRDIAAAMYRLKEFSPHKVIYVTDVAQELHFSQVFKVMELYDPSSKGKFVHVKFGRLSFGEVQMSTRKGNIVPLDEVLDRAKEKVKTIIEERKAEVTDKELTSDRIGIGAVVFNDLSVSRIKNIGFDWEKTLSFDGETGPHIQYSYVRILNILNKIENGSETAPDSSLLTDDLSFELMKTIERFGERVLLACQDYEPSVIAGYLIELSKAFNRFYQNNRVVGEQADLALSRAGLLHILCSVYGKCMDLIGIPKIEKM
jgi:arginyl-tRNA synthetase